MKYTIAYYVHHHGSGHFMRASAIAKALAPQPVTFLGSELEKYSNLLPENVSCLELPSDVPEVSGAVQGEDNIVDCFHYAPVKVSGITRRTDLLTHFFAETPALLLIVDVSVEVTLLARLASIPTIVIRQHGKRIDPAHLCAYQSAELLIAPYDAQLESHPMEWVKAKTFYSGGFSRFSLKHQNQGSLQHIAILIGQGGTSINGAFVKHIAEECPQQQFQVIGKLEGEHMEFPDNVIVHGILDKVEEILLSCRLVIGNLGHNTVMEMATLNRCFIGIPELRPFDEQMDKGRVLESILGFKMVLPSEMFSTNWRKLISEMQKLEPCWGGVIHEGALLKTAKTIRGVAEKIFNDLVL